MADLAWVIQQANGTASRTQAKPAAAKAAAPARETRTFVSTRRKNSKPPAAS